MGQITIGAFTGPFLGVGLSLLALHYLKQGVAGTLMTTTPILMIPFVMILYKEKVSTRSIMGTVLAVIGVAILWMNN